jgi:hypothetical protein
MPYTVSQSLAALFWLPAFRIPWLRPAGLAPPGVCCMDYAGACKLQTKVAAQVCAKCCKYNGIFITSGAVWVFYRGI